MYRKEWIEHINPNDYIMHSITNGKEKQIICKTKIPIKGIEDRTQTDIMDGTKRYTIKVSNDDRILEKYIDDSQEPNRATLIEYSYDTENKLLDSISTYVRDLKQRSHNEKNVKYLTKYIYINDSHTFNKYNTIAMHKDNNVKCRVEVICKENGNKIILPYSNNVNDIIKEEHTSIRERIILNNISVDSICIDAISRISNSKKIISYVFKMNRYEYTIINTEYKSDKKNKLKFRIKDIVNDDETQCTDIIHYDKSVYIRNHLSEIIKIIYNLNILKDVFTSEEYFEIVKDILEKFINTNINKIGGC